MRSHRPGQGSSTTATIVVESGNRGLSNRHGLAPSMKIVTSVLLLIVGAAPRTMGQSTFSRAQSVSEVDSKSL